MALQRRCSGRSVIEPLSLSTFLLALKTIPETFMHEGRRFELEQRSEYAAIYRQIRPQTGAVIALEVHRIRRHPDRIGRGKLAGLKLEAAEQLASNSEFGRHAWSFGGIKMMESAIERFDELNSAAALKRQACDVSKNMPKGVSGHGMGAGEAPSTGSDAFGM